MYKTTCESCESKLTVDAKTDTVSSGDQKDEIYYLHDVGLAYECPVCGYESGLVLDSM
jgi:hypothetical protein